MLHHLLSGKGFPRGRGPFRRCAVLPALAALCFLTTACGRNDAQSPPELVVYAGAGLTDVLTDLAPPFEKARNVDVVFNFAASNTLAQQIIAAPRADIFFSASEKWMDAVEKAGRLAPGSRRPLLSNTLAVVANRASDYALSTPEDLASLDFAYLAVGDPAAVPAGIYAKAWLESLPHAGGTLWDAVEARVSPAPDVRAALVQVEGRRDVIGIVYQTDYAAAGGRVRLLYALPAQEGPPITFLVAALSGARQAELARAFLDHLASPEAVAVFERHGFTVLR